MNTQNGLAISKNNELNLSTYEDIEKVAKAMVVSGYFVDSRDVSQAIVKILAGQEMGFRAFASMNGIHIIKGKPGIGANLQAAAVKSSGKYDYKVREMSDKVCKLEFFQGKESLGFSEFTLEDARKAGTQNLDKFPRNMLFARAMSNGVKWYCPDVLNGVTAYTPEELGASVNEDGDVIDMPVTVQTVKVEPPPAIKGDRGIAALSNQRPWTAEQVLQMINQTADVNSRKAISDGKRKLVVPMLEKCFAGPGAEEKRYQVSKYLTGHTHSKDIPDNFMIALYIWLNPSTDNGGEWLPDEMAAREAGAVLVAAQPAQDALI